MSRRRTGVRRRGGSANKRRVYILSLLGGRPCSRATLSSALQARFNLSTRAAEDTVRDQLANLLDEGVIAESYGPGGMLYTLAEGNQ